MNKKRQQGMTLMELMVAGTISVIAISGMVALMASTLGTSRHTINATNLSAEMRTAMLIITREIRRANYHDSFLACFGDPNCTTTLGLQAPTLGLQDYIKAITISTGNDCIWFWYDRSPAPGFGAEPVAGFRRTINAADVGIIQMTTEEVGAADCGADAAWTDITDPGLIDVTAFYVGNDVSAPYDTTTLDNFLLGKTDSFQVTLDDVALNVERIGIRMTGQLTNDASLPAWLQGDATELTLQNFIRVRNDLSCQPDATAAITCP